MTRLLVIGAAGRMGRRIMALALANPEITLIGGIDSPLHPDQGEDVGFLSGGKKIGVFLSSDLEAIIANTDVIIDFTAAATTEAHLKLATQFKKSIVIGSTGHNDDQKKIIQESSKKIPIVQATNMSVGVNVLWHLIDQAAKLLGPSYDIEVLETHHRLKKDAPSGTAMTTAEVLAAATNRNLKETAVYHREGLTGERTQEEIGIQTLRGGDVIGDHTVFFFGEGERLEITHRASSRDTFAQGALRAALWLAKKPAKLYSMKDVLGL